jgi:hypothetical protein
MNDNKIETDPVDQQNGTIATTTYVRTGKPGHPSKYTPTAVRRLIAAIADGMTNKAACIAANIGVATLRDWRKEHPDLEQRMEEVREKARQKALRRIKAAAEQGGWRADAEWLKLTFPQDYRRSGLQPATQTNNLQVNAVVLPPEEQERLIEQRRRLLAQAEAEKQQHTDVVEAELVPEQQQQQQPQPSSLFKAWADYQKLEDDEPPNNNSGGVPSAGW